MKTKPTTDNGTPKAFIARHGGAITGVLSGFDRLRFRGTLRTLQSVRGMMGYLSRVHVLLKDFKDYVTALSDRIRSRSQAIAQAAGGSVNYLPSSLARKDAIAQQTAAREGIKQGLIGVWSCVEPCLSYFVRRDAQRKELVLKFDCAKCLHHYFYFAHPLYGLMHLRLQTWFPFGVTVCMNGRQWLARQMNAAGIGYVQQENCFSFIEDVEAAQRLANEQLRSDWPKLLGGLLGQCHPLAEELCRPIGGAYYWSVQESEYATDLMFRSPEELARLYPRFIRHGMEHFGSRDVLRFLGKRVPAHGVHGNFEGELNTTLKQRPEGVCIRHYAAGNSIKLYDKQGSVLRAETTINRPEVFRVYRTAESHREAPLRWLVLRRGIADIHRRAQLSNTANQRYLEALAEVHSDRAAGEVAEPIFKPVTKEGRRYRALNPWAHKDGALLETITSGAWTINGFRNRDIRGILFAPPKDKLRQKRHAARVSRLLALLRAHGIIQKVTGTHRYLLSRRGRQILTALQAARRASIDQLLKIAA